MTRITADWIGATPTQKVCAALETAGGQAFFVGGCVRNTLLEVPASDIDISTDLEPAFVVKAAEDAGIKPVPTGIEHGTITLVCEGMPHEVTTFRRDVATDGRRAVVAFSTRIEEDAARRDFTMNAIYARPDGTIVDPLGGMADLRARRVRFIGDAQDRIREDYLRSLRYFRFHAWYGDEDAGFDAEAMAAIAANLDGLSLLSHERVGAEMLKLLAAPDPAPSVAAMRSTGALAQFLPGADDRALAPMVHLEQQAGVTANPVRRLAALGGMDPAFALRLSKADRQALARITDAAAGTAGPGELGYRLKLPEALDAWLLRLSLLEQPWRGEDGEAISAGAESVFPVTARDLMPALKGKEIGRKLAALEARWIASGFVLTCEDLLSDDT